MQSIVHELWLLCLLFLHKRSLLPAYNGSHFPFSELWNCPCILGISLSTDSPTTCKQLITDRLLEETISTHWIRPGQIQIYLATDGQSTSLSWYQAIIWDQRPISLSLTWILYLDSWGLLLWGSLSDERTRPQFTVVAALHQRSLSMVWIPWVLITIFYFLKFETPQIWGVHFPIFISHRNRVAQLYPGAQSSFV
jgi:hypothetical protein